MLRQHMAAEVDCPVCSQGWKMVCIFSRSAIMSMYFLLHLICLQRRYYWSAPAFGIAWQVVCFFILDQSQFSLLLVEFVAFGIMGVNMCMARVLGP